VREHPEVEAAYTVAGAPSAIVHLRAEDNEHLERALERIRDTDGVLRTETQIVLSTLLDRPVAESNGRPGR
jgi:DNA-binding Lrp family transcriptional regulator